MTFWAVALYVLFCGYFLLAGYDYGVAMLSAFAGPLRAEALDSLRPVLLRNEVWLVAGAGILIGAFAHAEEHVVAGLYPLVSTALVGVAMVTASVPLFWMSRGRLRRWMAVLAAGGAGTAASGWGAVLGNLLVGLPWRIGAPPVRHALFEETMTYLGGSTMVALMLTHGAAYLAACGSAELRRWAEKVGRVAASAATALLLGCAGHLSLVHGGGHPFTLAVLWFGLAGLLLYRNMPSANRSRLMFGATTVAMAVPMSAVAVVHLPIVVASSRDRTSDLTLAAAASNPATLHTLSAIAVVAVPVMAATQLLSWWLLRTSGGVRQ